MDTVILDRRLIYDRWMTLTEMRLRLPNGAVEIRAVEDHGRAAAVLLYDPARRVALLIRQPRAPVIEIGAEPLLEAVAGRVEGRTPEAAARAECMEEAGVRVATLEPVATIWPMPAVSTERLDLYLAAYGLDDRIGAGGGAADENECITLHEVALDALWADAAAGRLQDGKTLTLVQALRLRRPELFAG